MLLNICFVITLIAFVSGKYVKNRSDHYVKEIINSEAEGLLFTDDDNCVGYIPRFSFSWSSHVVETNWTNPLTCVTGFIVFLNDSRTEVPYDNSIEMYSQRYDGLEACTVYQTGIYVIGENGAQGELYGMTYSTLPIFSPGAVSNISSIFFNNSMVVSWDPPSLQGNCMTGYDLLISDINSITVINTVTATISYELSPTVPCMSYSVRVIAMMDFSQGWPVSELIISPEKALQQPALLAFGVTSFSATLIVSLEPLATNACEVTLLTIQCTEDNTTWFSFTQSYEDSPSRPAAVVNITSLSPNTNYTCKVSATNSGGTSEASVIAFKTSTE